jgi:hypothetical protein
MSQPQNFQRPENKSPKDPFMAIMTTKHTRSIATSPLPQAAIIFARTAGKNLSENPR